ncbi:Winged helix-turn-helix DNA-binding domain,Trp repressor/replication initiator [Cinara cedri]|uniref:Winged helix-turn-helix DNA-binding domain,Trp repressor/replication initiator n=1 Tax=Cinara cedri TaxID=506608 RepID=A0A5E4M3Z6_9HEMI|nr:Winged helix-turn-helix DNA-binding domain,Trp repressor/replication initiator [Cinara cedri]
MELTVPRKRVMYSIEERVSAVAYHLLVGGFRTETAKYLNVNKSTFNNWCTNKQIVAMATFRRRFIDLAAFTRDHPRGPTGPEPAAAAGSSSGPGQPLQLNAHFMQKQYSYQDAHSHDKTMVATAGILQAYWNGRSASAAFAVAGVVDGQQASPSAGFGSAVSGPYSDPTIGADVEPGGLGNGEIKCFDLMARTSNGM